MIEICTRPYNRQLLECKKSRLTCTWFQTMAPRPNTVQISSVLIASKLHRPMGGVVNVDLTGARRAAGTGAAVTLLAMGV